MQFEFKKIYQLGWPIVVLMLFVQLLTLQKEVRSDIGGVHSWRQAQTMWNVRNFARHDANILNPRVNSWNPPKKSTLNRYEFPVYQWPIAMAWKFTGEKVLLLRLYTFLIFSFGAIGIFLIARQLTNDNLTGIITAGLYIKSPLLSYYCINPLPDVLALTASIWYIYFYMKFIHETRRSHLIWASSFLLLATLSKLPFLMISFMSIIHFCKELIWGDRKLKHTLSIGFIQLLLLLPAFAWYAWVMPTWKGNPILEGVLSGNTQWGEYQKIINYHLEFTFPQIITFWPLWLFPIVGLCFKSKSKWVIWSLVFITMLYLSMQLNAIGTIHDYYFFPFIPWIFMLSALGIKGVASIPKIGYFICIVLLACAWLYTPSFTKEWRSWEYVYHNQKQYLQDYGEELRSLVPKDELCIILNDNSSYILSYYLDQQGHVFHSDMLQIEWIPDLTENYGIHYMFSDSEKINNDPKIQQYIESILFDKGDMKVFKLKNPKNTPAKTVTRSIQEEAKKQSY